MDALPPAAKQHFAKQRMDTTAKAVSAIADETLKDSERNRRAYERFYNNLALFSGGTIALSVTYLGYLKTVVKPIVHQGWLVDSWIALIVCLSCSLFWTLFHTHYGHYYRDREYWEATKVMHETWIDEIEHLDVSNLRTSAQLDAFKGPRREAVSISEEKADHSKRLQNIYYQVWLWTGRLARVSFVTGMVLLVIFAIKNN